MASAEHPMNGLIPEYLNLDRSRLGEGQPVQVRVLGDMRSLAEDMADEMARVLRQAEEENRAATLIVPVGPIDQFPLLAERVNRDRLSLREAVFIGMNEYLTDSDEWLPIEHPLSFRGCLQRRFYELIDPELAPKTQNRVCPDPRDPGAVGRLIEARGGVDGCFGGIGINGHIAFNEPPEPGETCTDEAFRNRPTRVLSLSRETRTINAVTVGGDITLIPRRCVTVGMREILASRSLRFYCNRPWQSGVVRRVLHGPLGAACPASFLRTHPDATLTLAEYVAERPVIRLR